MSAAAKRDVSFIARSAVVVALCLSACSLIVDTNGFDEVKPVFTAGDAGDATTADATSTTDAVLDASGSGDVDAPTTADATSDAQACAELNAWTVADHCYFVLPTRMTQPAAKSACVASNAHLATVTTTVEHDWMVLKVQSDAWIGLEAPPGTNDKTAFSWITGEPKTVEFWDLGPDEATGCVVFNGDADGWADRPCDEMRYPLCERP